MTFLPQNGFKGKLKYVFIFDIAEKRERSKQEMVKSYHDNNTYTEYVGTESYNNAALPF